MPLIILAPFLLTLLSVAIAQDSAHGYPSWVTNDYSCVIKCIEDQVKDSQPPATDGQTAGALGCVRDACSKDTAPGNTFQAHYIINMFNTIGSIYEPESWQAGNAPNASDLTAPSGWTQTATTATWTESDEPTTVTTSVWVPPTTSAAVSAPVDMTSSAGEGEDPETQSSSLTPSSSSAVLKPSISGGNSTANATGNATDAGTGAGRTAVDSSLSMAFAVGAVMMGGVLGGIGLGM